MKKLLLFLCFLTFQFVNSQNINFPNANFKSILINSDITTATGANSQEVYIKIDLNDDNEISIEEALNVSALNIFNSSISDLAGLEFFTNLKRLSLISDTLTQFTFPSLINLEVLSINSFDNFFYAPFVPLGFLTILNIDGNSNLKSLSISTSNLTSLNLSNNNKLKDLSLYVQNTNFEITNGNPSLTHIRSNFNVPNNFELSGYPRLLSIDFSGLGLTTINTSNNLLLSSLAIYNSNISTVNLSGNQNLESVQIYGSSLNTLNLGNIKHIKNLYLADNKLATLDTSNLFNLQFLECQNNLLKQLSLNNDIIETFINFSGNPNLETICCDSNEIVYIQNQCNTLGYTTNISACIVPTITTKPIAMSPNPVIDMLYLESKENINKVEVFAASGLLIMTNTTVTDSIDMQSLTSGMYFLKVYRGTEIAEMKFIKV